MGHVLCVLSVCVAVRRELRQAASRTLAKAGEGWRKVESGDLSATDPEVKRWLEHSFIAARRRRMPSSRSPSATVWTRKCVDLLLALVLGIRRRWCVSGSGGHPLRRAFPGRCDRAVTNGDADPSWCRECDCTHAATAGGVWRGRGSGSRHEADRKGTSWLHHSRHMPHASRSTTPTGWTGSPRCSGWFSSSPSPSCCRW